MNPPSPIVNSSNQFKMKKKTLYIDTEMTVKVESDPSCVHFRKSSTATSKSRVCGLPPIVVEFLTMTDYLL